MAVFGPVNGTNNAVSSSAHLGVHGRVVGSFLSLLTAVAFFSLSVWSSGDALVGGAHRLFGLARDDLSYAVAYALFAVLVLAVCVYGFRFMLFVNKIAVTSASALFLLGAVAFGVTSTRRTRASSPTRRTRRRRLCSGRRSSGRR